MQHKYTYNDRCPVCEGTIKRRPAEFAGRPCPTCMEQYITPRDRYRIQYARMTPDAYADILRGAWNARQRSLASAQSAQARS